MLKTLVNFNPISFLDIDTNALSPIEIENLRQMLMSRMGEYVLLKLSHSFNEDQLKELINTQDGEQIMTTIKSSVSSADKKIIKELEKFKKDFKQTG